MGANEMPGYPSSVYAYKFRVENTGTQRLRDTKEIP
jgi:hypothetical protein